MKILSVSNYQSQNNKKQDVNFGAIRMSKRSYKLLNALFPNELIRVEGRGLNLSADQFKEVKDLCLTKNEWDRTCHLDHRSDQKEESTYDYLSRLLKDSKFLLVKKAIKEGNLERILGFSITNEGTAQTIKRLKIEEIREFLQNTIGAITEHDVDYRAPFNLYQFIKSKNKYQFVKLKNKFQSLNSKNKYQSLKFKNKYQVINAKNNYQIIETNNYQPIKAKNGYQIIDAENKYQVIEAENIYQDIPYKNPYQSIEFTKAPKPADSFNPYQTIATPNTYQSLESRNPYAAVRTRYNPHAKKTITNKYVMSAQPA